MHFRRECTSNHGMDFMPETSPMVSVIGYPMGGLDHVSRDILKELGQKPAICRSPETKDSLPFAKLIKNFKEMRI
jgi:hypothetical protein